MRETGAADAKPHAGGVRSRVDAAGAAVLEALVAERDERTLAGLVACMTVDAAADTDVLVAFTRHVLVPALRPGQVVVLDNVSAHQAPAVRALVEGAGCTLRFLPPYSPDLNPPIEAVWSKRKTLLRGVGARLVPALNAALSPLVDAITAEDARGYCRHCGYAAPR